MSHFLPRYHGNIEGVKTSLTWDTISPQNTKCKPWQTSICCCVKKRACVLMLTSTKPFVSHITVLICWVVCYLQGLLGDKLNHFCLLMVERMMWRAQRPREVTCTATTDCCYLMTVRIQCCSFLTAEFVFVDMTSLKSVRHFVRLFRDRALPLHVLVNNGRLYKHTDDGLYKVTRLLHIKFVPFT